MNPKQSFLNKIFKPLFDFFEFKLRISPMFAVVILVVVELLFFMKYKTENRNIRIFRILLVVGIILGIYGGIIHTIEIRSM